MNADLRRKIEALGPEITPAMLDGSRELCTALVAAPDPTVEVTRDHFYGPDERHRLDVFRLPSTTKAPVLVFVHGGGFVMGDKTSPGSPFYDNVGQWAALQGWIGVTMTYRLAPAHRWPSGIEDMALAVGWLCANIAGFGGDPERIVLMGQSAGASHVGSYISHPEYHADGAIRIAGAVLLSGTYDTSDCDQNPFHLSYYGDDPAIWQAARMNPALLAATIPMLFAVSELDGVDFRIQAARIVSDWAEAGRGFGPVYQLDGHNHVTPVQLIGSAHDTLGPLVRRFVERL